MSAIQREITHSHKKNMPEPIAQFRTEGEKAFPADKENENSSAPQAEENENGNDPSSQGAEANTQTNKDEKELPFHEHPRWKERETQWDKRFNEQESRHQDDLKKIREEFSVKRQENADNEEIPPWFGGDKEQWDKYREHEDKRLKQAEDRAYERIKNERDGQEKLVKEATDYMQSEISSIETDKTLNPDGLKVDPNRLLKIVLDNELVDSKSRWNYRAGWLILKSQMSAEKTTNNKDRKTVAGATTSESKAESKTASYKTSADFKKNRPW